MSFVLLQMPLFAVGLTEHETPFTFGSAIPPLSFSWSVNKKSVAELQSVFHKVSTNTTVLPAKSDSDVMFCLQRYQGLIIDRSLVCYSYL